MKAGKMGIPWRRYICDTCGFIFDEEFGDPVSGIEPGTRWEDIPDDWICSLCGDPKAEFSLAGDKAPKPNKKITNNANSESIVIIGSGYAGWRLVKSVRALSDAASITMLTKSSGDDYNRTQLSKVVGRGSQEIVIEDGKSLSAMHGLDLVSDCEVIGIDKRKKIVITNGGLFNYDKLVIAAGSTTSQIVDSDVSNVYTIDQIDQFERLSKDLSADDCIGVIGGGLIGCEVADSLRSNKYDVTLINRSDYLLSNLIPELVAMRMESVFKRAGMYIVNNASVSKLVQTGSRVECKLSDGSVRRFDKVISCIGTSAITDFASRAGLKIGKQGIIVDQYMRIEGNDIYGLGDCVEFEGVSHRYLSTINAQADVIANELANNDQKRKFSKSAIVIKIKTPSFPITIYEHQVGKKVESWKALEDENEGIIVELFQGSESVGIVEAGSIGNTNHLPPLSHHPQ